VLFAILSTKEAISAIEMDRIFIFKSFLNSFHYLYQDAEYLHQTALRQEVENSFEHVRLCRTALLLYILSVEGLINRAWDHFLREDLRDFLTSREEKFSLVDKWLLLPSLAKDQQPAQCDESCYPWTHFKELIKIRNDFVHPKYDRPA